MSNVSCEAVDWPSLNGVAKECYLLPFSARLTAATTFGFLDLGACFAFADTLPWALVQAYQNNPQLNAQRAAVRATDESVPQAL